MNLAKRRHVRQLLRKPVGEWEVELIVPGHRLFGRRPVRVHWRPEVYKNNRYVVQLSDEATDWGLVLHLWIRRHDEQMIRSWSELQEIKNTFAGPNRVAVEVFPPAGELVDQANMSHLWVLPEGFRLPFSLEEPQ